MVATGLLGLGVAACGNASVSSNTTLAPVGQGLPKGGPDPGVTSNSITVGALATESGALAPGFGEIVEGAEAYFDMVNAEGGVNGRKIYLKYNENDGNSNTNDTTLARNLVEEYHVFAVVGVGTPFFTGAPFLAQTNTPTFGYVVTTQWDDAPSLFGAYGSFLGYATEEPTAGLTAAEFHAKSVAVLAYNFTASSQPCSELAAGIKHYGYHLAFEDLNFGIGGSPDADVRQMVADHVDLVFSCMEGTDNLAFSEAMHQYGLKTHFVWLNGYSQQVIKANGSIMNGVVFFEQHVPFEAATQFPGKYPAVTQYMDAMKKYFPNDPQWVYDDTAIQGWISADQFVTGLRAIGRDVTQTRLIDAINDETDFTAGGLEPPLNWRNAHSGYGPGPFCGADVEDENGVTHVIFNHGSSVFICIPLNSDKPVPAPPGTPGG